MRYRAFAGATVANVGCAFDILGFSLAAPGDAVEAEVVPQPGVVLEAISGDSGFLPRDTDRNCAAVAAAALLRAHGGNGGLRLKLDKGLPIGSGLGSSAASSAAAAVAANAALGSPFAPEQLVPFAMEGERAACGSPHADNVAPAILGGFVLVRSYQPLDLVRLDVRMPLHCAVCHPHLELRTSDARRVLRREVPLQDAVVQWGNVAGLITGLLQGDPALIRRSIDDRIIEPVRAPLIPGYPEVKRAALDAGALGCSISGAGPSVFAFTTREEEATAVAAAMQNAFATAGIESDLYLSPVSTAGCKAVPV